MASGVVNTGFDPVFGNPLWRFLAAARAQGINAHIISGVRDDEDQRQLVANAAATRAGTPLPYPGRGRVPVAAPVGGSTHEFGLAADVQADNPADQARLIALGQQFGLSHPMAGDPTHFQAPDWRQVAANQPPPTPWSQAPPSSSMLAYGGEPISASTPGGGNFALPGGSPQPARPATGAVAVRPDFLTALQHYESGGRNIPNVHQGTSSGQAQGYNQITTGTWNEFGGQQYAPDPLHATLEQQNAIAAKIPMGRWAPETLDYLRGQGFKVDPKGTLADNITANQGAAPAVPGATINTTGAPAAAGGGGGPLPGFTGQKASDQFTQGLEGLNKALGGGQGQQGQGGQGGPKIEPSAMIPAPGARGVGPGGGQLLDMPQVYGQTINSLADPQSWAAAHPGIQWGAAPPGSPPLGAPGLASAAPPGLNAMQQLQMLAQQQQDPFGGFGYG